MKSNDCTQTNSTPNRSTGFKFDEIFKCLSRLGERKFLIEDLNFQNHLRTNQTSDLFPLICSY